MIFYWLFVQFNHTYITRGLQVLLINTSCSFVNLNGCAHLNLNAELLEDFYTPRPLGLRFSFDNGKKVRIVIILHTPFPSSQKEFGLVIAGRAQV